MSIPQKQSHISLHWNWLIVLIVLLDQGPKYLVVSSLGANRPIGILPSVDLVLSSHFLQGLVVRRVQFRGRGHHGGRHRHYGVNLFGDAWRQGQRLLMLAMSISDSLTHLRDCPETGLMLSCATQNADRLTGMDDVTEPHFLRKPPGLTVGEIAALTGAELQDVTNHAQRITNIAPIDLAEAGDLTFVDNAKFAKALTSMRAGAILISKHLQCVVPGGHAVLLTPEPYKCFVLVARKLYPDTLRPSSVFETDGIAAGASVHPTAQLASGVTVDPGALIGPRARIGAGALIGANSVIGPDVRIGHHCAIGPGSSVTNAIIGDRVIVHPGCHIGQDGFGFIMGATGHLKVPQLGIVVIEHDVEIGAGTTVDRGGIRNTVIGEGTKIDNLVQIAHNVVIGRHCIIAGQSGLSGSVTLGDFVILGARVGIRQHVTVGNGARLAARSSVMRDVPAGALWGGFPNAKPLRQFLREVVTLEQLASRIPELPAPSIDGASIVRDTLDTGLDGDISAVS